MAPTKWDDAMVVTAGVLLAAGRPLVSYALEAMAGSGLPLLVVVTGAVDLDDLLPAGAVSIANPAWEQGQGTSLAAALGSIR